MSKCSYNNPDLLPDRADLNTVAELFKCMGDPCRLAILTLLRTRELLVGELARQLNHSSSAISHQLRILRGLRLVRARREGRNIWYALDDEHVAELLEMAFAHSGHGPGQRS